MHSDCSDSTWTPSFPVRGLRAQVRAELGLHSDWARTELGLGLEDLSGIPATSSVRGLSSDSKLTLSGVLGLLGLSLDSENLRGGRALKRSIWMVTSDLTHSWWSLKSVKNAATDGRPTIVIWQCILYYPCKEKTICPNWPCFDQVIFKNYIWLTITASRHLTFFNASNLLYLVI